MLVSIIIPCYNSIFLEEAVVSCRDIAKSYEILIVDDCSSINIPTKNKFPGDHIKIFRLSENRGAGYARQYGLNRALGDLICFLDSDDTFSKAKKDHIIWHIDNKYKASCSFYSMGNSVIKSPHSYDLISYLYAPNIGFSTMLVCRDLIDDFNIRFSNRRNRQDTEFNIAILLNTPIYCYDNICTIYRSHANQISKNKVKMAWKTLQVYFGIPGLSWRVKIVSFINYIINGIQKHM